MKLFIVVLLLLKLNSLTCAQDSVENGIAQELQHILDQAEKYRAEKQTKILSIKDLQCTFWIHADPVKEEDLPWSYLFLTESLILFVSMADYKIAENLFLYSVLYPDCLARYIIKDNKIFVTDKLSFYLEGTYLFVGDDSYGYTKYKLQSTFNFLESDFMSVMSQN